MRLFFNILSVFLFLALGGALSQNALAQAQNPDFSRFYLNDPSTPHNSVWEHDDWQPQHWIDARGSTQNVMNSLYRGGIIVAQSTDGATPVLVVGRPFLRLSNQDKRRVTAFVDEAYGITEKSGLYAIRFAETGATVGVYAAGGLQLQ